MQFLEIKEFSFLTINQPLIVKTQVEMGTSYVL